MFPLTYILKSLQRRRLRTLGTVAGVALAIALYAAMGAVGDTMTRAFKATGEPEEVVISQAGAMTVEFSSISRGTLSYIQTLDGVAGSQQPLVSPELVLRSVLQVDGAEHDVTVRGVTPIAAQVYGGTSIAEGRPQASGRQALVGRALAKGLALAVGDELGLEGGEYTVVGLLDAGGRVYDQEVWVDIDDLAADTNRPSYSSYTLRATDATAADALVEAVNDGKRFPVTAAGAEAFYARVGGMASAIAGVNKFIAMIIVLGAILAGMNAMYSSVAGRRREIGVLRALGYRKSAVLTAFVVESLAIATVGGVLGLALGSCIVFVPLDLPYVVTEHVGVGGAQVTGSIRLALIVGLLGGMLPAVQAARLDVVDALRG